MIFITVLLTGALLLGGCESLRARTDEVRMRHQLKTGQQDLDASAGELTKSEDGWVDPEQAAAAEEPAENAEEIAEEVTEPAPEETEPEEPEETREPLEKYRLLLQVNPYIAGWLKIDGTAIDAPVVYTPASQNYFLHRDIDGSEASMGTLFIAVDWQEGYNNTLIYGHNMKDGTSFGSLARFADASYGLNHPVIRFDTLYEEREYQLFAAFYSQIDEEELETEEDRKEADKAIAEESLAKLEEEGKIHKVDEETKESGEYTEPVILTLNDIDLNFDFGGVDIYRQEKDEDNGRFRYYYYTNLSDKDDFDYYLNNIKERALYDTGVEAEWGDEFVTLSTCSYHVKNGRFILVGVRKP
ncbi:MAG: class B sortase [Lachnospiraceae bacterium]|nr:class B sortase [Lachnospiraceae bacterium]